MQGGEIHRGVRLVRRPAGRRGEVGLGLRVAQHRDLVRLEALLHPIREQALQERGERLRRPRELPTAHEPRQRGRELVGGLPAPVRIRLQALQENRVELDRQPFHLLRRRVGDPGLRLDELHDVVVVVEALFTGEQLEQHQRERVEIAARVDAPLVRLLRRHVLRLPLHHPDLRLGRPAHRLGDPEVEDLHVALVGQQDVVGREIAMHELQRPPRFVLGAVRVLEPEQHVDRDVHRERRRELLSRHQHGAEHGAQVLAVHVFEDDVGDRADRADFVHADDVAMREPHADPRLVLEHRHPVR